MGSPRSSSINNTNDGQKLNNLLIVRLTELKCNGQKQGLFFDKALHYLAWPSHHFFLFKSTHMEKYK